MKVKVTRNKTEEQEDSCEERNCRKMQSEENY